VHERLDKPFVESILLLRRVDIDITKSPKVDAALHPQCFPDVTNEDFSMLLDVRETFRPGPFPRAICLLAAFAFASWVGTQAQSSDNRLAPAARGAGDTQGATPLILAASKGDVSTVKSLLTAGAAINETDRLGRTALIFAVESGQRDTARALVAAGADLNVEARYIGSALNVAENNGDNELATFLLGAGAHSTGKSIGDTVCVRSWGGQGYCGTVKSFTVRAVQIAVTKLVGCEGGCPAREECSHANPVGGVNGLQPGEQIAVPSWCLTDTAVKQ
jgi:hypothetical protein